MTKYIEQLLTTINTRRLEVFSGLCVFCLTVMGTSVKDVASTASAFLLIASLFAIKHWRSAWHLLSKYEKWLMMCMALYALSGVIAVINVQDMDEYIKDLERYMRFALGIPIYLFIRINKLSLLKYLHAGAVISGPFLLMIALPGYLDNPDVPARGYYHHIIYGAVAMLNVGVMLAMLLTVKMNNMMKAIIFISILCGLLASVLSQSRGVWLVLPLYLMLVMYFMLKQSRMKFAVMVMVLAVLGTGLLMSPAGDIVKNRVASAVDEVTAFYDKNQYISSLGTRLAMWEIALDVWQRHPVVGTGPGDFDEIIKRLQKEGQYTGMEVHESTHNIYVQSMVNAGTIGLVTMLLIIIIMPLKIFIRSGRTHPSAALTGIVFILLFATLGFGESWTLRSPTVSVYIIFLLTIVSSIYLPRNHADEES